MSTRCLVIVGLAWLASCPAAAAADDDFTLQTFQDGRITVLVPGTFHRWSGEEMEATYPPGSTPEGVFSNDDGSVTIALQVSEQAVSDTEVDALLTAMTTLLPTLVPGYAFLEQDLRTINNRHCGVLTYEATVAGTEAVMQQVFTSYGGRLLTVTCGAAKPFGPDVHGTFTTVINSLTVR